MNAIKEIDDSVKQLTNYSTEYSCRDMFLKKPRGGNAGEKTKCLYSGFLLISCKLLMLFHV